MDKEVTISKVQHPYASPQLTVVQMHCERGYATSGIDDVALTTNQIFQDFLFREENEAGDYSVGSYTVNVDNSDDWSSHWDY